MKINDDKTGMEICPYQFLSYYIATMHNYFMSALTGSRPSVVPS